MRGRYPSGPEYVDQLEGSSAAKKRLRIVLETMTGKRRVQEACEALAISEQRFYQLRAELLQAALERLESRPAGRPRRHAEKDDEMAALEEKVAELEVELRASQVREEIALAMPKLLRHEAPGKKTAAPKRRARPGWWRK